MNGKIPFLVLITFFLMLLFTLSYASANITTPINYESDWISTNGNLFADFFIKNSDDSSASPSFYNLTVFVKRTGDYVNKFYNQTTISFSKTDTLFKISFQTNHDLKLSYSLYILKLTSFNAHATASNNETVLPVNSTPLPFVPSFFALMGITIIVVIKRNKSQ